MAKKQSKRREFESKKKKEQNKRQDTGKRNWIYFNT